MHDALHREYYTAHYARVGGTENNEHRALLLSLLFLKSLSLQRLVDVQQMLSLVSLKRMLHENIRRAGLIFFQIIK